jgi:hypothetical protein
MTKILVIDDKQSNLDSAKKQFQNKDVDLTCCPLYSVAVEFIKTKKFDIVLTDLMMIAEAEGVGSGNPEIGKEVPYGLILSILARNCGVTNVAIMTDVSHHSGPIAWAMDQLLVHRECNLVNAFPHKKYLEVAEFFMNITDGIMEETKVTLKKSLMIAGVNDDYKRMLANELADTFNIIMVDKKDNQIVPIIFVERNPDYTLLIGEIDERGNSFEFGIKNEFEKLLMAKRSDQKLVVSGWLAVDNPHYLRLPFTVDYLVGTLTGN